MVTLALGLWVGAVLLLLVRIDNHLADIKRCLQRRG
jgi:hypothetical protein